MDRRRTKMSNLPIELTGLPMDLAEEMLSKVPVTSMRSVRSTCKKWNTLSKCGSFAKKQLGEARLASAREFMVVVMMDFRVYLMRVNLHNDVVESGMNREGKLIGSDEIDVCQVFNCDGLLLCISKDNTRIVVCNPLSGQSRSIEATHNFHMLDRYLYALGYDKSSSQSLKILRFIDRPRYSFIEFKIYDFSSDSWRVLDVANPDWNIYHFSRGVSLKGDTYWFAIDKYSETPEEGDEFFLVCFDFTTEGFGRRLPLPFEWCTEDTVGLSSVREEQLAVLFQRSDTLEMEIWITSKIEPNEVSWSSKVFLQVNMKTLLAREFMFAITASFFIDEEKKVAVVLDKDSHKATRNIAYMVGNDGSLKEVDLGESPYEKCLPLVCSYVPSLGQLN